MNLRQKLVSQSSVIFGARVMGAGVTFLAQVAIARLWGSQTLGEYLLIIATINIIAVILPLGFETIGTYFAAEYRAKGEGLLLRGFLGRAYTHITVCGLLLLVLARPVAAALGGAGALFAAYWLPASILAIATGSTFVSGAILVGLKRPFAGLLADAIIRPLLAVAGVGLAVAVTSGAGSLSQLLWTLAIGYGVVAAVHLGLVLASMAAMPVEEAPRPGESKRWWRFALPWVVIAVASDYFFDIDLLLLSGHLGHSELAIFGVCARVFALVSFGVASVYAVTMPDMFESEAIQDRAGFHRKVGDANLVASGLAVVLFALTVVFAPLALMLFGPAFQAGAAPLAVLCLGLVVRSVFGPASLVLSIHDRPYASLPAIALGVGTLVVGNTVLVPPLGLMGAAMSALIAITIWSAALWFTALKITGVDVSIRARLMPARTAAKAAE